MKLTPKQKEYWLNANARWNIKTGATRSGKTWLDFFMIPRRIRERIGLDGTVVLLGNTQSTLWRNVLEPMQKIYGVELVSNIKANNQVELFGETCYALGADKISQVKKIQGSSIKYCYGDEVATWSKEVWEMLKSRLDKAYSCFDGTLNPDNKRHWFKVDFLDVISEKGINAFVQKYTIDDNPMLDKNFVLELKKEYLGTVYYARFIRGEWTNAEGLLFQQLADNPKKWEVEKLPFFIQVNIGVDIGGTKSHTPIVATGIEPAFLGITTFKEKHIKHSKGSVDALMICEKIVDMIQECIILGYYPKMVFVDNAEQVIINTIRAYVKQRGYATAVVDSQKYEGKTRVLAYNLMLNLNKMKFYQVPKTVEALTTAMYDDKSKDDKILDDFSSDIDTFDAHFYSFSYFLANFGLRI